MEITEKVAYLKGLAEGMELDTEKKEGKLLAAIIDVLDDIALEIADMKADQEELYDGLDAVSDDLEDVEDAVFGEDDEDEEDVYEYEEPEEDEEETDYEPTPEEIRELEEEEELGAYYPDGNPDFATGYSFDDLKKVRRVLVSDDADEKAEREAREVLPSVMGSDIWEAMLDEFEGARERVARLMDNHNV